MDEQINVYEEIITPEETEVTERVDVLALARAETNSAPPPKKAKGAFSFSLLFAIVALVFATVALVFSVAKTNLIIGQGELYVQDGVVNELLGNLIRNDLSSKIPSEVNVREINIKVTLYGNSSENYSKVSDITDSDSVFAEIVFFPQGSVEAFARDCRAMLDVMTTSGVIYDEIIFIGEDRSTSITAKLSGRLSADITVEEIMDVTFYFGEIDN